QNDRGEIMMLCIEGRQLTSLGIGVVGCAEILSRYGCQQAMNLDGGTSAILWYNGKCVTRCSNEELPEGRTLPNAFVYERKPSV
ncbi:MAG: phosphodiester glycosidase family protein, partial [Oscillospiraceae bacterium]|nr:phosphodiester glycosidase family protein [Oscillospiraceae bacterium]